MLDDPDGFFTRVETLVRDFAKVIISCRTQFFKNKADERARTHYGTPYQKVYLELLDVADVRSQVANLYRPGTADYIASLAIIAQTGTLFRRPLLLSYLPDLMEQRDRLLFFRTNQISGDATGIVTEYEVYASVLSKWLQREDKPNLSLPQDYGRRLFEVSMKLALTAFYPEGRKQVYYADLRTLIDTHRLSIDEALLRDRSLLRRNDDGYYSFAHRTFKEFFFAHLLYEGLIPEDEFPFDAYEDAGRFYNQMAEVRYFQHPACRQLSRAHVPGKIGYDADALLPRPLQAFCQLKQIPRDVDVWGVFAGFCSGLSGQEKACLTAWAYDLVSKDLDTVDEEHLRSICMKYRTQIGDLLRIFFVCKTGERYGFIHRAFAEHLCLRGLLLQDDVSEAAARFPFDKLRFTRLFRDELRWLDLQRYGGSVTLLLDNGDVSEEELRQSSATTWYEYLARKAALAFADCYPRLAWGDWRLCIRTQTPPDLGFLSCIPFAERIEELDLSHNGLQGDVSLAQFAALKKLRLVGNPGLRLTALPPSLKQLLLSERDGIGLPPGFQDKVVFREAFVRRLAGDGTALPEMLPVSGGRFWMGSGADDTQAQADEKPLHLVEVGDFHIGKYPVTVREFACFVRDTGYVTTAEREGWGISSWWKESTLTFFLHVGTDWTCDVYGGAMDETFARHPVIQVSWHDAQAYCAWLSTRSGHAWGLPSEAEWEYAAIGGQASGGRDALGNVLREYEFAGDSDAKEVAWHWERFIHTKAGHHEFATQAVGQLKPNALGICDMSDNVYEWCADWYDAGYYSHVEQEGMVPGPRGPETGSYRVLRGGSWINNARSCRTADRDHGTPYTRNYNVGFRLVFVP
ncbi:MAG: hypothetical protein OHK0039_21770 [Bacteroidia bacterium]